MTTPTTAGLSAEATITTYDGSTSTTGTSTTRICIKNVHPSFDENKLKSHLQKAQPDLHITDCKLLKTIDGKSRKIAFVGFQTASQAETAVSYFDKSFAGTARLSVSLAFSKNNKKNHPSLSVVAAEYRPWSKHSKGSSRYAKLHKNDQLLDDERFPADTTKDKTSNAGQKSDEGVDRESEIIDRKREEFLSAMGINTSSKHGDKVSKSKFWANDDAHDVEDTARQHPDNSEGDAISHRSRSSSSSDSSSIDSSSDDYTDSDKDTQKTNERKFTSDLDFIRSKQVNAEILTDESDNDEEGEEDKIDEDYNRSGSSSGDDDFGGKCDAVGREKVDGDKIKESVPLHLSSASDATAHSQPSLISFDRLFVRNLPFTTTEEDLYEKFNHFGHVIAVHIPVDDSKRNKGYAFISFEHAKEAKHAMESMDGVDFQGRLIHILPARPSADQSNDVDESTLTYKDRQALARQKEAEKSSQGWSASFLRGDAVVDNLSERLGVSKGDILNVKDGISSGNAAVRLALGETHIISENISFFESHGVDVTISDSKSKKNLADAPKRSKTMILVKNLPFDTSLEDLRKVFHGIGGDVPQRILLPPSKTAALVEYGHPTDARRAFRSLAYKKFKHVPLYLEWAPMMAIDSKESSKDETVIDSQGNNGDKDGIKPVLMEEVSEVDTSHTGGSQTVYVKNINFSTSEDALEKAFVQAGFHPRAIKIPMKTAPLKKAGAVTSINETRQLSMGFGFVEFSSEEIALKAIQAMQGKILDGHALDMKLSTKSLSTKVAPSTEKSTKKTKIIVRNVPFEASRVELLQLFGSFGHLKNVRLPKKFDGTHRGFAFCEFLTSKEAHNAMTTLSRTHLYGRHLVLEWAEGSDESDKVDVNAIMEKAKRDTTRASLDGQRKRKHLKFI